MVQPVRQQFGQAILLVGEVWLVIQSVLGKEVPHLISHLLQQENRCLSQNLLMLLQQQLHLLLFRLVFRRQTQGLLVLLIIPQGLDLVHELLTEPKYFCIPCIHHQLLSRLHVIRQERERLIHDIR